MDLLNAVKHFAGIMLMRFLTSFRITRFRVLTYIINTIRIKTHN